MEKILHVIIVADLYIISYFILDVVLMQVINFLWPLFSISLYSLFLDFSRNGMLYGHSLLTGRTH